MGTCGHVLWLLTGAGHCRRLTTAASRCSVHGVPQAMPSGPSSGAA